MSIQTLLGLDKFQVNYISKSDPAAWTKADLNKEVANNYRIYYDSVLCHHMPQGESMGMPGCHGHHHRQQGELSLLSRFGHYEWHQLAVGTNVPLLIVKVNVGEWALRSSTSTPRPSKPSLITSPFLILPFPVVSGTTAATMNLLFNKEPSHEQTQQDPTFFYRFWRSDVLYTTARQGD